MKHTGAISRVAVTLVAYLGLRALMRYAAALREPLERLLGEAGLADQVARFGGSAVVSVLMAAIVVLYVVASGGKLRSLGLCDKRAVGHYLSGVAVSLLMMGAIVGLSFVGGGVRFVGTGSVSPLEFVAVMMLGVVNVREELLYRGWMMNELRRSIPTWVAVTISSLLFGLAHLHNPGVTPLALINLSLLGAFWALCLLRTGSLWTVMAMHTFWNFAQSRIVGLPVSGGTVARESLLHLEGVSGGLWGTGTFGLEGNLATTVVIVVAMVVAILPKQKLR